jgi:hypothetical protein
VGQDRNQLGKGEEGLGLPLMTCSFNQVGSACLTPCRCGVCFAAGLARQRQGFRGAVVQEQGARRHCSQCGHMLWCRGAA